MYLKTGLEGRERDCPSRSRGLSTWGRGTHEQDKPPVLVLADRGSGDRYVLPAKAADKSTIRLSLDDRQQESLTVYTEGLQTYNPLDEDNAFIHEHIVHGDAEYADGATSIPARARITGAILALATSRYLKDNLTPYLGAFQLRRRIYRKPGKEAINNHS